MFEGSRSLKDYRTGNNKEEAAPEKPCGGKGPNRHVIDSYGAGENVIAWIKGNSNYNYTNGCATQGLSSTKKSAAICQL